MAVVCGLSIAELEARGAAVEETLMRAWCRNTDYPVDPFIVGLVPDHLVTRPRPQRIGIIVVSTMNLSGAAQERASEEIARDVSQAVGQIAGWGVREAICSVVRLQPGFTRLFAVDTAEALASAGR